MGRLMTVFGIIIVLGKPADVQAKALASPDDLRPYADSLMTKISRAAFDGAGVSIKEYSVLPEEEVKSLIGRVKLQINMMLPRFGKGMGYEFIKQEMAGASVVRLIYISKHEHHAMPWTFVFYKSSDGWTLNQFLFNDNLCTLF